MEGENEMSIISRELAQRLVDHISGVIPNNINIIDENGMIIASREPDRLDTFHKAGYDAIRNDRIETVKVFGEGMKPGINMPFHYRNKACGVVGISGPEEETIPIASLIKYTIELLVEQELMLNTRQASQLLRAQFLQEWLSLSSPPSAEFIAWGHQHQINVTASRTAAIIHAENTADATARFNRLENSLERLNMDSYIVYLTHFRAMVVLNTRQHIAEQLRFIQAEIPGAIIGLGRPEAVLRRSYMQAQSALRLGRWLRPDESIHRYEFYRHYDAMIYGFSKLEMLDDPVESIDALQETDGNDLLVTLLTYFRLNGERFKTADALHIHRNTLSYRLDRIHSLTGMNPRNPLDLQRLIGDYIIWCYRGQGLPER